MRIKAVLFDLDGTLVDTIPDLTYGLNQMLDRVFGKAPLTVAEVSTMVGQGVIDLMQRVFQARGIAASDALINRTIEIYCGIMVESGSSHSEVFKDVFASLTRLRQAGFALAIVTNKPKSMTEALVKEKGLAPYVDSVIAAGDAPTVKPAPEMLWLACEKLGVDRNEAVMVGDSANDALAARNARMPVYLVTTGYNGEEPISVWAQKEGISTVYESIHAVTDAVLSHAEDSCDAENASKSQDGLCG